ncbi:MAG TPA: hypothetical protein VMU19_10710, partial [Bryobacteraceae bacterium]|nr:hypothetical protein [Bryobacteraceae bacterium]
MKFPRSMAVLLLGVSALARAQVAAAPPRIVQVDAVVTDSQGAPVADLAAGDFAVSEGGQPRRIVSVAYVNGPRAIAFVADNFDSVTDADVTPLVLSDFVERRMAAGDVAAILPSTEGCARLTSDKAALSATVARIRDTARVKTG